MDLGIIVLSGVAIVLLLWNIKLVRQNKDLKFINEHNRQAFETLLNKMGFVINDNGDIRKRDDN